MAFAPNLQVLSAPGFWIMLVGFLALLTSGKLATLFKAKDPSRTAMIIKAVSCAAVVLGAVLVFV